MNEAGSEQSIICAVSPSGTGSACHQRRLAMGSTRVEGTGLLSGFLAGCREQVCPRAVAARPPSLQAKFLQRWQAFGNAEVHTSLRAKFPQRWQEFWFSSSDSQNQRGAPVESPLLASSYASLGSCYCLYFVAAACHESQMVA